jgi:hypothetical protein
MHQATHLELRKNLMNKPQCKAMLLQEAIDKLVGEVWQ